MISLIQASRGAFFKNNKNEIIYDGMVVHSVHNKDAEFRISGIKESTCTYEYRYSKNANWTIGNSNYSLATAKSTFVVNGSKNTKFKK